MKQTLFLLLAATILTGCSYFNPTITPQLAQKLRAAYAAGDYFTLAANIDSVNARFYSPEIQLHRVTAYNFTNKVAESEAALAQYYTQVLDKTSNDTIRYALLRVHLDNVLKLQRYADAVACVQSLLEKYTPFMTKKEVDNFALLQSEYNAVSKVVPMVCDKRADSELQLSVDKFGFPKVQVRVRKYADELYINTQSPFCTVAESTAGRFELRQLEGTFDAVSPLFNRAVAGVAVADELRIGNAVFRNVPFIVFPDKAMWAQDSMPVRGTLGFNILHQLEQFTLTADNKILIPQYADAITARNIGLDGTKILVASQTRNNAPFPMYWNMGASKTTFYGIAAQADTAIYNAFQFNISDKPLDMDSIRVDKSETARRGMGVFGRDMLKHTKAVRVNLKSMRLSVE